MSDHSELKRMAKSMKGWDNMSECWPCDENGPDWQVGRLDEDDNRWPLLTVDSEQYDQEQDAPMIAQYYAAANPAAVLALIAEVERLSFREKMLSEYGCEYCAGSGHVHRIDGDYLGVCDRCSAYEFNCAKHEIEKLKNENESLKKDAARYRWLREKVGVDLIFGDYSPWLLSFNTDMTYMEKKTTDEAIDAAMTKVAKP